MITIDGAFGEGGGQIVRSALSLSLVTGKPFRIVNIRANRRKKGLMRQHLTAVNAAAEISDADLSGNCIGSDAITFAPKSVRAGAYRFAVGTAGSATLVFQTVLPALLLADRPSTLILEGGTHNAFAPPFGFLEKSFLGVLNRMGPLVQTRIERWGFYPAGGGKFTARITPAPFKEIALTQKGEKIRHFAVAYLSHLPKNIAQRELAVVRDSLGFQGDALFSREIKTSNGPGNILMITLENEHITEVFTGFGEKGVSAERVAKRAVKAASTYLNHEAPVGEHLADQLLIPFALAGKGVFHTHRITEHTLTNKAVIEKFLDLSIVIESLNDHIWECRFG